MEPTASPEAESAIAKFVIVPSAQPSREPAMNSRASRSVYGYGIRSRNSAIARSLHAAVIASTSPARPHGLRVTTPSESGGSGTGIAIRIRYAACFGRRRGRETPAWSRRSTDGDHRRRTRRARSGRARDLARRPRPLQPDDRASLLAHARPPRRPARGRRLARRRHAGTHRPLAERQVRRARARLRGADLVEQGQP